MEKDLMLPSQLHPLGQNMNYEELQYLNLLARCLNLADDPNNLIPDRTGTGRYGEFGAQMRFNLRGNQLPVLTTKKVFTKGIRHELIWMISGSTNIKYLVDNGVHIWDEWADEEGELGPVYGQQWRKWKAADFDEDGGLQYEIDQLAKVIEELKKNKHSTRHLVSAWNPQDVPDMALPPCHTMFQFHVNTKNELSCQLYQRSADMFLGVPFNIAFYAMLTHMVAKVCGYTPGDFVHTLGDYHIYTNHIDAVREQLGRKPMDFPTIELAEKNSIDDFTAEDIRVRNYNSHPPIKAEVSV
jgi:thymidylate synthase